MKNFINRAIRFIGLLSTTALGLLLSGFLIYLAVSIMWQGNRQTIDAKEAIIVLTGSQGRIDAAFELLLDGKAEHLFISGVNDETTLSDILDSQGVSTADQKKLADHCCIILDYAADTTEANARESGIWIRENDIDSIILVTASYHMPRAVLLFQRSVGPEIDIAVYPVREERRFTLATSKEYWILAVREYSKYLGSWVRLQNQDQ